MSIKINNTTVIDDNRNFSNVGILTVGSGSSTITFGKGNSPIIIGTGVTIGFGTVNGDIIISGILTAANFSIPLSIS